MFLVLFLSQKEEKAWMIFYDTLKKSYKDVTYKGLLERIFDQQLKDIS